MIEVPTMILPEVRDPGFVTVRRGGTLTEPDHHLLALWAASCAEHVLGLQLPEAIRDLVLDDQRLRNKICWSVLTAELPRPGRARAQRPASARHGARSS